jgi:hypothetical protein
LLLFLEEGDMKQKLWRTIFPVVLALALTGARAEAQQPTEATKTDKPTSGSANPDVEEKALAVFNKMAAFLSQAPKLSVTIESGYDAVQPSGLKVEFGETRKFIVRRPDRMRIDTDSRDGNHRGFRFDGKEIGVFDTKQKVYATAEKPGTTDHAVDYFIDQLQMPIPLSELFASNLPKFTQNLDALYHVEETTITGVRCDHLVGSTKNIDFQVWVAQGDKPLLQRLIITYKREEGEPQRWAQFRDWNLSPDVLDSLFAFTPPEGAEKIPFAPRKAAATETVETTEQKGGTQ